MLTPLGFVADAVEAGVIAERLATMEDYDGPPIDPNEPIFTVQRFGPGGPEPDCATKCQNAYNTDMQKCKNTLTGALKNCGVAGLGAAVGGCIGGGALCWFIPPASNLACCAAGAVIGAGGAMGICVAMAQNNFDVCMANAWEDYALCMLNNCGIIVVKN